MTKMPKLAAWIFSGVLLCSAIFPASAGNKSTLNLSDADISTVIEMVGQITGKNFVVDPRVKGKVTILSNTPMSPDEIYGAFLSMLETQGFAAVEAGAVIKIIQDTNAKQAGGSGPAGSRTPDDDYVTQVVMVENVSANQLVAVLRPLMAQSAHLAAYTPSNMLIVSDRAGNVERLVKLIKKMDQTSNREIEIIKLKNAGAAQVVQMLTATVKSDPQKTDTGASQPLILADERTNSVLLGGERDERARLKKLIAQLDTPAVTESQNSFQAKVVYLRYAKADKLAPILENITQRMSGNLGSTSGTPVSTDPKNTATGNPLIAPEQPVRVLAEPNLNALILTGATQQLAPLLQMISQLDIPRRKVRIEAIIAEMNVDKARQLGVDWAIFNDNRIAAGSFLSPSIGTALGNAGTAAGSGNTGGLLASLLSAGLNVGGGVISGGGGTSLAILLKALNSDGDTNIVSMPNVLTLDNEEAELSVGQEVPFITGSFTGTGGSNTPSNPFQTVQRRDVGLKLKVKPHINEIDSLDLNVELEVSSLSAVPGAVDLATNKRTLRTPATMRSDTILILGGLIDDTVQETENSVPILGQIPILGELFRYRSARHMKRNLMVFIRPVIINDSYEDVYTRNKYNSLRNEQIEQNQQPILLMSEDQRPVLPGFESFRGTGAPNSTMIRLAPEEPARYPPPEPPKPVPAPPAQAAPVAEPVPEKPQTPPEPEKPMPTAQPEPPAPAPEPEKTQTPPPAQNEVSVPVQNQVQERFVDNPPPEVVTPPIPDKIIVPPLPPKPAPAPKSRPVRSRGRV